MREAFRHAADLATARARGAFCTVVETTGSTPQKPGAKLLVLPDFTSMGTLGGGCVEAEARKRAAGAMQSGTRELLTFRLNDDYGWDDGLICGGTMRVFVDLTDRDEDAAIYRQIEECHGQGSPVTLSTVIEARDPDDRRTVGSKLLVCADGRRWGSLGSDAADDQALGVAIDAIEDRDACTWTALDGGVIVYTEPLLPQIDLLIAGAGHVGAAVCRFAALCDFRVTVIDDRPEYANRTNLPDAHAIVVADIAQSLRERVLGPQSYVVIVTRGHRNDEECLDAILGSDAGYKGLIGSRRKLKLIFDDLRALGAREDRLTEVHAPIGIDIGSKTVPEIAISIVAELIQTRNARKVR